MSAVLTETAIISASHGGFQISFALLTKIRRGESPAISVMRNRDIAYLRHCVIEVLSFIEIDDIPYFDYLRSILA